MNLFFCNALCCGLCHYYNSFDILPLHTDIYTNFQDLHCVEQLNDTQMNPVYYKKVLLLLLCVYMLVLFLWGCNRSHSGISIFSNFAFPFWQINNRVHLCGSIKNKVQPTDYAPV